jgi:SAM-dependent methyltransferase
LRAKPTHYAKLILSQSRAERFRRASESINVASLLTKLDAELYSLTHRGNPGDAGYYARLCKGRASVLELGCGAGRLLCRLARKNRMLIGLEFDTRLRSMARSALKALPASQRERSRVVAGDMRSFRLGTRFERILLPYNGLYCLLSRREVLACFKRVRAQLAPGGIFAFDIWSADSFHAHVEQPSEAQVEHVATVKHRDRVWDVFEQSIWRRRKQHLDVLYSYHARGSTLSRDIYIPQRYLLLRELRELLMAAGLRVLSLHADFRETAVNRDAERLVVQAVASSSQR